MRWGLHRTRSAPAHSDTKTDRYAPLIDTSASDPFVRFLEAAPIDDEAVSAEEEAAKPKSSPIVPPAFQPSSFEEIKRSFSGEAL
jgi:hypothetical protein